MRKLQALHLITTPGVRTTTDVVLTVIQDLERALLQAPGMHLKQSAAETDWDAEFAAALGGATADPAAVTDTGEPLPEDEPADDIDAFRRHHMALHEAARAVL
ncbi:MAG: hypothetical protein KY450_14860, partial [Actinobacteria bacterium]|nr:hypothetical protein [Actinomycetota bacterium]